LKHSLTTTVHPKIGSMWNDTKEEREKGATASSSYEPVPTTIGGGGGSGTAADNGTAGILCIDEESNRMMTANHGGLVGDEGEQPALLPQPHICCYCCCDCRRACLVINLISIVINMMILLFVVVGEMPMMVDNIPVTNPQTLVPYWFKVELLLSIVMHGCGMYGAIYFKPWGIILAGAAYAFDIVVALSGNCITCNTTLIFSGCFLYPHLMFVYEMNKGIMNDYNYHQIAFCCGAVTTQRRRGRICRWIGGTNTKMPTRTM